MIPADEQNGIKIRSYTESTPMYVDWRREELEEKEED